MGYRRKASAANKICEKHCVISALFIISQNLGEMAPYLVAGAGNLRDFGRENRCRDVALDSRGVVR
jgi:hypothetical protein